MNRYLFVKKAVLIGTIFLCFNTVFSQGDFVETSGDVLLFTMPAAAIFTTISNRDKRGTWQFAKGLVLSQALTYGLKLTIDKERPDNSNSNSFPSGHTSVTFQSASFVQKRYGWKLGLPAYLLAGYTGYSRIESDKHDVIDVLAGAIIGVGSAYLFTTAYDKEKLKLTYNSANGEYLIGFRYTFK